MTNKSKDDSILHEVARLRQVELELKARLRQQAMVAKLSQRALAVANIDTLMNETTSLVAQILEVDYCKILELLPGERELLLRAGVGWKEGAVGHARVSAEKESQAGFTLMTNTPVIVKDLRTESRFSGPPLLHEHEVISGISVIIPGKVRPFGVLGVHTKQPRTFTQDDTLFLLGVANVLASAIVRRHTEDALRSSRDQLAFILQGVADGITAQDTTGNLIYANHAAARSIGFNSEEELLSTPLTEVWKRFEIMDESGNPFPLDQLPGRLALKGIKSSPATVRFRVLETGEERWSVVKATPVTDQSGRVELVVNIFQDVTELKRSEQSQRLLAEAGRLLSASLDYSTTLVSVAQLAITSMADWCAIHIVDDTQTINPLAVAHVDPLKVELAKVLQSRYPPDRDATTGVANVLRTGKTEFYPEIKDSILQASARDEEHLRFLRELGLKSAIIVPLVARDRTLGTITFVWAESGHKYTPADVALAEELARRAALAIDNARLYREAQSANTELEQRVAKRTYQLQTLVTKLKNEIAERKKAEEALRKNERVLHSLFESSPDATLLVNSNGEIVRVNAQAEAMFGYPKVELIGKFIDSVLPERFQDRHIKHRLAYFTEPRTRPMGAGLELYGMRKDGTEFPIDIMLSPVETEAGRLVICAVRDITERKQMQAELTEVHRRLIESIEAERVFLAQELHDGPIQDLYGVTYRLSGIETIDIGDGENTAEIQEQARSSMKMVKQVIELLRSICGDLRPPALVPFGLEKAIHAHIEQINKKHPDLAIQLDLMPDGQIIPERVRLALYRIYQHAVSNVIRHSQAEHLRIKFSYDESKASLRIEDDGCGFELPNRWVELARGGHLGLVGTAERVQAINGNLEIISSPGKGTMIQVTAPIHQNQEERYKEGVPSE